MIEMLEQVAEGPWFTGDSPFRASLQPAESRVCVITGPNSSGKSLVRKILYGLYEDAGIEYMHTSQAARSRGGIHRAFIYGTEEEDSTGYNSVRAVLKAIQTGQGREKPFGLMFDEPEIGCSEEVQAAIGDRIGRELDSLTNLHGLYIVTHSRVLVQRLMEHVNPTHLRLGGDDTGIWTLAYRELGSLPELEEVVKRGKEGWSAVQRVLNKRREST